MILYPLGTLLPPLISTLILPVPPDDYSARGFPEVRSDEFLMNLPPLLLMMTMVLPIGDWMDPNHEFIGKCILPPQGHLAPKCKFKFFRLFWRL